MARFVLVHGAFAGAWIWGPVKERLEAAGHSVQTLDLPGSGDDTTPVAEVTLEACAERVREVLESADEPAVLVGNSMGGVIATQAASNLPDRVASLIYVAAFVPHDGQSLLDLTKLPEGADDQVQANLVIDGDPPVGMLSDDAYRLAFCGDTPEEIIAWELERARPQAVAPFATPVSLDEGALERIPRSYVLTENDRAIPPALQRRMLKEAGCAEVVQLETDHHPSLSMPDELAAALDRLAP